MEPGGGHDPGRTENEQGDGEGRVEIDQSNDRGHNRVADEEALCPLVDALASENE
jgi:hypothetical protein